jgi:hypothetical protein
MYPFARKLANPQALADVAAYVQTLCIPRDSGKYAGPDAVEMAAGGKLLYEKECSQCHQPNGEGVADKFYPVLLSVSVPDRSPRCCVRRRTGWQAPASVHCDR